MQAHEPKKLALIRILQILQEHSDIDHPLTQQEIADRLENDYGIVLERKAISSDISLLKEAGYSVVSGRNGSYLDEREFNDSELRMLIDSVLGSRHVSAAHSKDLIKRICGLSNKWFKPRVKHVYSVNDWNKTENQNLFLNIDVIDEAIESGRQVAYRYNKYGSDKKLHKSSSQQVSPYQMILHNQRYYLMGYSDYWEHMVFHRLDRMSEIRMTDDALRPLRSIPGHEHGMDYRELSSAAYMYTDEPEQITFITKEGLMDQIIDWFGKDIVVSVYPGSDGIETESQTGKGTVSVSLRTSPNSMYNWALQYLDHVELIAPESLRERLREAAARGAEKYSK